MHRIPKDFDPAVFAGKEFEAVTFATNLVSLVFEDGIGLTVFNTLHYRLSRADAMVVEEVPTAETTIMSLIGRRVTAAEATETCLSLYLQAGGKIILWDDSEMYESFIVRLPDREIVV